MPPSTPDQWRDQLNRALDHRWNVGTTCQGPMRVYDAYYNGDQTLAFITRKYRDAYGGFFKGLTDNWCPIVVDSSAERLRVQGIRFGNEEADADAWDMWQDNNLDAAAAEVHTEAIKLSVAYWMVQPPRQGENFPQITGEHPRQTIVAVDPADKRKRLAGFKKWYDASEGKLYANVYLPDRYVKYASTPRTLQIESDPAKRWTTIDAGSNPLGEVPLIPVPNNPSMLTEGKSDLAGGVIELQDAINLLLSTQLIGAEYMAYPLRVLLGVDTPIDPATGNPIPNAELKLSQSRLLMFPGNASDMDVKELSAADLENIRNAMDGLVRDLTAQSRTPPHYVAGQIVNASGDALKASETGLVSKVRRKMDPFGEAHEDMLRLAFKAMDANDPRAEDTGAEIIWRDPEVRSDAERVDAATKLSTVGVPNEILWEKVGFSPQEIDRMQTIKAQEDLLAAATQPPPPGPGQIAPAGGNGQVPADQVPAVAQPAGPAPPAPGSR